MSKFKPGFWKRKRHAPTWARVLDLPEGHVKAIKDRGLWCCHQAILHPGGDIECCEEPPAAEACRDSGDGQMVRSLFCEGHLRAWCELKGLSAPSIDTAIDTSKGPPHAE